MFLLQTQPNVNVPDSIRQHTHEAIELLVTNPELFWSDFIHSALIFGVKVLVALLVYALGSWLIGVVKRFVAHVFEKRNTEPTVVSFVSSFISISLTVLLIIITIGTLGVDTTSLAALLAAGGMAIGMALSGTVQNFAGGIMLLVFKPFKVGDFIDAQGNQGTVVNVSIVSTTIRTTENQLVVLPNGALSNGTIRNFSSEALRRTNLEISVAYGTEVETFKKVVMAIIKSDSRILDSTTAGSADPFIKLKTLNSSDITFLIRVWIRNEEYWDAYFNLIERIYTELPQNGIQFAYPHLDVNVVGKES